MENGAPLSLRKSAVYDPFLEWAGENIYDSSLDLGQIERKA